MGVIKIGINNKKTTPQENIIESGKDSCFSILSHPNHTLKINNGIKIIKTPKKAPILCFQLNVLDGNTFIITISQLFHLLFS